MAFDDKLLIGLHFPTSDCENEPEPCGDFNKSAGLLYVTTYRMKNGYLETDGHFLRLQDQ